MATPYVTELPDAQSPEQLAKILETRFIYQTQRNRVLENYYEGRHKHAFESADYANLFGKQLREFKDNWMKMIIEASVNRLTVQGFRVGLTDPDGTSELDNKAWNIWQANHLDQASLLAHREAMTYGSSYLLVDPFYTVNGFPRITVESAMQMVAIQDPTDRYTTAAALKRYQGLDGYMYMYLYTPDTVYKWQSDKAYLNSAEFGYTITPPQSINWQQTDELTNPLGECPVVTLENAPTMTHGGASDLEDLIPLQDALNKIFKDALVASEYLAFPQRVITNVDIPKDPVTGQPLKDAALNASVSRVWMFAPAEDGEAETKATTLPAADLNNYISLIEELRNQIVMVSNTPAYHIISKMSNLSADAIRAAEIPFVQKIRTKQIEYSTAYERAIGLALKASGTDVSGQPLETIWKSAEATSASALANEMVQLQATGIPQEALWAMFGASPTEIERWKTLAANEPQAPAPDNTDLITETPDQLSNDGGHSQDES